MPISEDLRARLDRAIDKLPLSRSNLDRIWGSIGPIFGDLEKETQRLRQENDKLKQKNDTLVHDVDYFRTEYDRRANLDAEMLRRSDREIEELKEKLKQKKRELVRIKTQIAEAADQIKNLCLRTESQESQEDV